ncbi:unnamed protein product [Dibothriocephalus latus]|uniref:Uncharacterized protein n=1 Tax=Dibothriocephalus latus TaxID=60516 RepID=A0A3P7NDE7_DIBLA|nr:unnamed protein product [Dibothriocephalus latus]
MISQNTFWTIMDEAGSNMNVSSLITRLNVSAVASGNPVHARQKSRPNLAFIRRYPVLRNEDCFDAKLPLDLRSRMRRLFYCKFDHIPERLADIVLITYEAVIGQALKDSPPLADSAVSLLQDVQNVRFVTSS